MGSFSAIRICPKMEPAHHEMFREQQSHKQPLHVGSEHKAGDGRTTQHSAQEHIEDLRRKVEGWSGQTEDEHQGCRQGLGADSGLTAQ